MERVMIEKNTIKSQDSLIDCNNGKRSSETLIETISKLETTIEELERTKKQLEIAKRGLNFIVAQSYGKDMWDCAKGTLKQIKELDK